MSSDPHRDRLAAVRALEPHTTPAERETSHALRVATEAWRAGTGPHPMGAELPSYAAWPKDHAGRLLSLHDDPAAAYYRACSKAQRAEIDEPLVVRTARLAAAKEKARKQDADRHAAEDAQREAAAAAKEAAKKAAKRAREW